VTTIAEIGKTAPRRGVQTFVAPLYLDIACKAKAEKAERAMFFLVLSIEGRPLATQFLQLQALSKDFI
jgi:hypothetical protein